MTAAHHVYINEPNDKAFSHLADYSHCNNGLRRRREKLASNGRWEGPFDESRAKMIALNSGKKTMRLCGVCAGDLVSTAPHSKGRE